MLFEACRGIERDIYKITYLTTPQRQTRERTTWLPCVVGATEAAASFILPDRIPFMVAQPIIVCVVGGATASVSSSFPSSFIGSFLLETLIPQPFIPTFGCNRCSMCIQQYSRKSPQGELRTSRCDTKTQTRKTQNTQHANTTQHAYRIHANANTQTHNVM